MASASRSHVGRQLLAHVLISGLLVYLWDLVVWLGRDPGYIAPIHRIKLIVWHEYHWISLSISMTSGAQGH